MTEFASPASATGINWADLNGSLLMVDVIEVVRDINTSFGPSNAVRATITVIDTINAGEVYADTLVFPKVLQSQLSPLIGQTVLGRLGQGQAKPGQSAPWMLADPTRDDNTLAAAFIVNQAADRLTADDI
jgi:hypothetical protein